jgi:hypothetical protein
VYFAIFFNYINNHSIIDYSFNWSEGSIPTIFPTGLKVPIPIQTDAGGIHYNLIAFGGIFLSILLTFLISSLIWYKSNQKFRLWIFLLLIIVIIQEIVMNAFCGTDNLTRSYSSLCFTQDIPDTLQIFTPWLIGLALWPFILFFLSDFYFKRKI